MTYNGHKDYEHWNVSLWLYNDYDLYQIVKEAFAPMKTRKRRSLDEATHYVRRKIEVKYHTTDPHTKDGVPFLEKYIKEAIRKERFNR